MIKIKKKIFKLYRETFWSLEKQAKAAGVTIGESNFIASHFWSSEPYLIKIGSHCAITAGVKIFTHGGAHSVRRWYPKFDIFGKVTIGDYVYIGTSSLIMPGVTIGNNVFQYCTSLEYICSDVFEGKAQTYARNNDIGFRCCTPGASVTV